MQPYNYIKNLIFFGAFTASAAFSDIRADTSEKVSEATNLSPTFADKKADTLTIEELVQQAFANNAELKFFEAEVEAAKGQRTQAGLWKNPEFSGEYGERRIRDSAGDLQNEGITRSASVTQLFEFPGKGSLRKAIANKNTEVAELGLAQFRLALANKIRQLAYQYVAAQNGLQASQEIGDRAISQIELLKQRATAGVQGLLELRIIESSLIESRTILTELSQSRQLALTELNSLRGAPPQEPLKIHLSLAIPAHKFNKNQIILTALHNNLLLKTREKELQKAAKGVAAAWHDAAPDFTVGPFYSQDRAGDNEVNIGLSVSLPLPLWNWNQGNIHTAEARRTQADALILQAQRQVEAEVVRRLNAYELFQKQLAQYPGDFLIKMREAAELADRHYRLGSINVQTFLEIQRQYLNTSRAYSTGVVSAQESILDLELLTGGQLFIENMEKK